jgi:hypothetical protein
MNEVVNVNGSWTLRTASTVSPSGSNTQVQFNDSIPTGTSLLTCATSSFKDFSSNNFTVTPVGNTVVSSQSPFGTGYSYAYDGTGDYLSVPSNAAFSFGTGDFTIECWVYLPTFAGATLPFVQNDVVSNVSSGDKWWFSYAAGNLVFSAHGGGGQVLASWSPVAGTWYHLAVTRTGGNVRIFIDGVLRVTSATLGGTNWGQNGLSIGAMSNSPLYLSGYISNIRIIKGTALYTTGFTRPTAAFPTGSGSPAGTSILTCASNAFQDLSTNGFTVTPVGDTRIITFSPFASSGFSNYFDGTGDYLTMAGQTQFAFGTGDFTIEFWINFNSVAGVNARALYDSRATEPAVAPAILKLGTSNLMGFYVSGATRITGTTVIAVGTWYHIAVSRVSGNTRLFVNGLQEGSTYVDVNSYIVGANNPTIGANGRADSRGADGLNGYISNLRVIKGTGLYSRNFTLRTTPFSTTSGVFGAASSLTYNKASGLLTTTVVSSSALTGSLTKLTDGTDYLRAGSNVLLSTGSNGAVTINSTAISSLVSYSSASDVVTTELTTSTSYTDLATVGPTVTMSTGTSVVCHIFTSTLSASTTGNSYISVAVSGASTVAASDSAGVNGGGSGLVTITTATYGFSIATAIIFTGLTPGTNTFTMKYRSQSGSRSFFRRRMIVQRLD